MMNLITRTGWEARLAQNGDAKQAARVDEAAVDLVDYLLFVYEAPLTSRVRGTSGFAEKFAALGPADAQGRSLRQLDLDRRLLKYPCSYMIYSAAFDAPHASASEGRGVSPPVACAVRAGKGRAVTSDDRARGSLPRKRSSRSCARPRKISRVASFVA